MKIAILILALASLPWLSMAQDAQSPTPAAEKKADTRFLGLEWGCSVADVKAVMAKQKDVTALREDEYGLVYVGGEYLGEPVETWHLRVSGGKLFEVRVFFEYKRGSTDAGPAVDAMVDGLTKSLTEKIGEDPENVKTNEHSSNKWSFSQSDPPTKDTAAISVYHNWVIGVVKVTYTNLYYQGLTPEAAAVDANEL